MDVFDFINLFGGLALFLYGMRLMGDSLKEGSSGALKSVLEKITNNPVKAFFLGVFLTAVIQSSTATIVITAGLVGAGILTLRQSMGIIIGANVGTTVTGQVFRLLDINEDSAAWVQIFKPSTLAPLALIVGVAFVIFLKSSKTNLAGNISVGFGILFTGLMTMTEAVSVLSDSGVFDGFFGELNTSPIIGYGVGAIVAFILQSSSASVGILQSFSLSGALSFKSVYAVILGIYLGDCVTTAIVCMIGANSDSKKVGVWNVFYNIGKTILVFVAVSVLNAFGLLDKIWDASITSGGIANANTVFNLASAVILFPFMGIFEKLTSMVVKDKGDPKDAYADILEGLNQTFFATPALALRSCYNVLGTMLDLSRVNFKKAVGLLREYDEKTFTEISSDEDNIDRLTDRLCNYLVPLSQHLHDDDHIRILDQYYKITSQFERLGDHALNISETAKDLHDHKSVFSDEALYELSVLFELIDKITEYTDLAFKKRDVEAARHIEPLEEVVDDMVNALRDNHLRRLSEGKCNVYIDNDFLNLLTDVERVSDICSNVGLAVVTRAHPELENQAHSYVSQLHGGDDPQFNSEYDEAHNTYFGKLAANPNKNEADVL